MNLPGTISGRAVTRRGVHLQDFGFHGGWVGGTYGHKYWTDLWKSMGMSHVVLIADGDSVRQTYGQAKSPLEILLDAGINPIIRDQGLLPRSFVNDDTVKWTVDLYGRYGLQPIWVVKNEPLLDVEWEQGYLYRNKPNDEQKMSIFMDIWAKAADRITDYGAIVGFPDGPSYPWDPFDWIKRWDSKVHFDMGVATYKVHAYGKNRAKDYPYDVVTQTGWDSVFIDGNEVEYPFEDWNTVQDMDQWEYDLALDDFARFPAWMDPSLEKMNYERHRLATPGKTIMEDDTCWLTWLKIAVQSIKTFGYCVDLFVGEGGWVPRDRPGTGPDTDIRMPFTTPKVVAEKTIDVWRDPFGGITDYALEELGVSREQIKPPFAICPWIMAAEDMGGSGWPFDAWHGWAYSEVIDQDTGDEYGIKKPIIKAAIKTEANTISQNLVKLYNQVGEIQETETANAIGTIVEKLGGWGE